MKTLRLYIIPPLLLSLFLLSSCKNELCDDTCYWPSDGVCDDGGEDSITDYCQFGTDCSDCGTRVEE